MSRNQFLRKLQELIENHLDQQISTDFLAVQLGMSRMQLHRQIKQITGLSTSEYIQSIRIEKAKTLLLNTQQKVKDIAQDIGYTDSSYFVKVFKKETNYCPRAYRMKYSVYYQ